MPALCHCHWQWLFIYFDRVTKVFKNSFLSASYVAFLRQHNCITMHYYEFCQLRVDVKYRDEYCAEVSSVNPSLELKDPFALTKGYSDVFLLVSLSIALSSIEVTRLHDCIVTKKCAPN